MPRLTIVIGANGAGKSTWCHSNRHLLPANFYDADSIAQGLGSYNDPERQHQARVLVDRYIDEHLAGHENFGFESTYSGSSRPAIIRRAHALGYEASVYFIGTNRAEINIARVAARVMMHTGHHVPSEEIIRRWTACQSNLLLTAAHFNRINLIDNSAGTARVVAQISGKVVERDDKPLPSWAAQVIVAMEKMNRHATSVPGSLGERLKR